MYLTWLDNNSWLIELAGTRILLDPWLVGDLTFSNLTWLFKGSRSRDLDIPDSLDLILLSQGLEDHAHPETLKRLDKSIPVVGSPSAAKVAQSLGFTQVTALQHGEAFSLNHQVRILATVGSPIGPMVKENGYLLTAFDAGTTLYYEPHGFHDPKLKEFAPIDVAITPMIDLALPFVGSVIQGNQTGLELAQTIQPQFMIPTAAGGNVMFEGVLLSLLKFIGSTDAFRAKLADKLADSHLTTQVLELKPGDRTEISVKPAALSRGG